MGFDYPVRNSASRPVLFTRAIGAFWPFAGSLAECAELNGNLRPGATVKCVERCSPYMAGRTHATSARRTGEGGGYFYIKGGA
ncbi:MAG: hypothetical protein ACI9YT_000215 [Halobacteriales archaeon]